MQLPATRDTMLSTVPLKNKLFRSALCHPRVVIGPKGLAHCFAHDLSNRAASQRLGLEYDMGANVPGKAHSPLFCFGGATANFDELQRSAAEGFPEFVTQSAPAMETV